MSLTYPDTEKSKDVKSGDRDGQANVPPLSPPVYDSMMTGGFSKHLSTNVIPSGGLNENLRTWRNF